MKDAPIVVLFHVADSICIRQALETCPVRYAPQAVDQLAEPDVVVIVVPNALKAVLPAAIRRAKDPATDVQQPVVEIALHHVPGVVKQHVRMIARINVKATAQLLAELTDVHPVPQLVAQMVARPHVILLVRCNAPELAQIRLRPRQKLL